LLDLFHYSWPIICYMFSLWHAILCLSVFNDIHDYQSLIPIEDRNLRHFLHDFYQNEHDERLEDIDAIFPSRRKCALGFTRQRNHKVQSDRLRLPCFVGLIRIIWNFLR
jgi:hypothetical protein